MDPQKSFQTTHLLVDLDGTLLGNRDLPLTVEFIFRTARTLRKYSGGWFNAVKMLHGMKTVLALPPEQTEAPLTNDRRAINFVARTLRMDSAEAEELLKSSVLESFPLLKKHFYPILEAQRFLDWAKEHYPLTLATDPIWPEHLVKLRLEWAEVDPEIFQFISHSGIMHACKPTPEYYREILELEELDASQCMLIGNDLSKDLPATEVGIPVFIITKDKRLKRIRNNRGSAPAWTGSFERLKGMLSEQRAMK